MKTILEIFYVRVQGKSLFYQRKVANLSWKEGDPNHRIRSFIQEKRRAESGEVEEQEFLVHSTSWRYEQPDKVLLTYVAYSDELEFGRGKVKRLPLTKLKTINKTSRKPRSQTEEEKKVVSHAMRHIAFLIQTGNVENFKSALKPETVKLFKRLWVSLAGRVF